MDVSSSNTCPIPDQSARGSESPAARSRTRAPSTVSRKMPSAPTNLSAFHSIGLWLAVRMIPPRARWCSTASWMVGVVVSPMSTISTPTDCSPATAAAWSMGPDVRASRPTTTRIRRERLPVPASRPLIAHTPNAAAYRATFSGVRSVPTIPRIPDTPTISVFDMSKKIRGLVTRTVAGGRRRRCNGKPGWIRECAQEGPDGVGPELLPTHAVELVDGMGHRERRAIGAGAGHGIERIRDRHQAHRHRDLVPLEAVGETLAVEPLVVRAHDGQGHRLLPEHPAEHAGAHHRVGHDVAVLLVRELARFVEHLLADADLPHVVQPAAEENGALHRLIETQHRSGPRRILGHAERVSLQVRVLRFLRVRHHFDAFEEHFLETPGLDLHPLFELAVVVLVLE